MLGYQTSFIFDVMKVKHKNLDLDVKQNHLDEIARAILRQALQDCHNTDLCVRDEAREWLLTHGEAWASGLELDWITGDMIKHYLQHGNGRKRRITSPKGQNPLYTDVFDSENEYLQD